MSKCRSVQINQRLFEFLMFLILGLSFSLSSCGSGGDGTNSNSTGGASGPTTASCGDGKKDPGESCDLGGQNSNTGACLLNCKLPSCGDGYVRTGVEECEDGNSNPFDDCYQCKNTFCGDHLIKEGVEECDDANLNDNDVCDNNCKSSLGKNITLLKTFSGIGDPNGDTAQSPGPVAVDPQLDVFYLSGNFQGTINFGGGTPNLTAINGTKSFLVKIDASTPNADALWAKEFEKIFFEKMLVDPQTHDLILTGTCQNGVDLGAGPLSGGLCLARFNSMGTHLWSKNVFQTLHPGYSFTLDPTGAVFIIIHDETNNLSYVKKFNSAGTQIFSNTVALSPSLYRNYNHMVPTSNGDLFLAKSFSGSVNDFSGNATSSGPTDSYTDLLISKLDGITGNLIWQKIYGVSAVNEMIGGLWVDLNDNLLLEVVSPGAGPNANERILKFNGTDGTPSANWNSPFVLITGMIDPTLGTLVGVGRDLALGYVAIQLNAQGGLALKGSKPSYNSNSQGYFNQISYSAKGFWVYTSKDCAFLFDSTTLAELLALEIFVYDSKSGYIVMNNWSGVTLLNKAGDLFLFGGFRGTVKLGNYTLMNPSLTKDDLFLMKVVP